MTRCAFILLLAGASVTGYTRSTADNAVPLWRKDAAKIEFLVHTSVKAGALNAEGGVAITTGSDPVAALSAAAASWSAVADSTVRFAPLRETEASFSPQDGRHTITIEDTPETRSIVGSALAITVWTYTLDDAVIVDTDIIFNGRIVEGGKALPFSTDRAAGSYDFQSVATHEFGHALGANHTGVISAAMFQSTASFSPYVSAREATVQSTLAPDDVAFLIAAYPAAGAGSRYGRISGNVRFEHGESVRGSLVTAVDPATGVMVGALGSLTNGAFAICGVPPGRYYLYAQPLDGPVQAATLSVPGVSRADTGFRTAFAGGNETPTRIEVTAGDNAFVEITVDSRASAMHIDYVGVGSAGGSDWAFATTRAMLSGRTWDMLLWGRGLDDVRAEQIRVLGPGMTVRAESLRRQASAALNGVAPLRLTIDSAESDKRAQICVAVVKGTDAAANSGTIFVVPDHRPAASDALAVHGAAVFEWQIGSPDPPAQILTVESGHAGARFAVVASSPGDWLTAVSGGAATPATIGIRARVQDLPAGTYTGDVAISTAEGSSVTVPVRLTVTDPPSAGME